MDCSSLTLSLLRYHSSNEWKSDEKIDSKRIPEIGDIFKFELNSLLFIYSV